MEPAIQHRGALQYLLDANVLIDANRDYYPLARVPEFWAWLLRRGEEGRIKIPREAYEEITPSKDDFARWMKDGDTKHSLLLDEEAAPSLVARVVDEGYAPDLSDDEVEMLGRDPFIIAYALATPGMRCVVTTEASRPKRTRANRKIPDVCRDFGIPCCNTFELVRALDFRTGWRDE